MSAASPVVLKLESLAKSFGHLDVTREVSLEVTHGEIHALIGPNGAGKSTLMAQIAGQLQPDSGRVWLNGVDVTSWPPHRRAQEGLGRTFQISSVFRSMSASANVGIALNAKAQRASPWRLFATPASRQEAQHALAQLDFGSVDQRAGTLGYGSIRQLEIAMGIAMSPTVLLLDEPLAGLSHSEAQAAVALLDTLRKRFGMLLIEHDMDAVFSLADRISVLVGGAIIATGSPDQIRSDPSVRKAYLGEA
ncbi:ABC transporter ATP-binding protein [Pusillimonas sp.]|uniref:ABC transporter ATP-binding protein n=1 Tax=Pusillimonas sp. TaxID=3040095 RepID=UPI0029AB3D7B|nr:ABC transporter ATP-binding protein [Pusillimonas sp.]MDX3895573.1 ABC transporter ATP-binding protein [Pusillimonas sp.]